MIRTQAGIHQSTIETSTPVGIRKSDTNTKLYIGGDDFSGAFNGNIDDVRLYNRILSSSDIQELYNFGTVAY